MEELYRRLEEQIALCRENCQGYRDDAFDSVVWASKLETLEEFFHLLKEGLPAGGMLTDLKEQMPALEERREQEAEYPSFDWYDDHYHYKVLDGRHKACKDMIELLEKYRP